MKLNYVNKIKANITIYASKKTVNILDGTYKSIYKGKSMNFENLREYVINDDVKDIDWKSSARSGSLLVKQFIAEKKHNIMLIMDTGQKMNADTDLHESKKEVALYVAGTIGYLSIKNNDYIGMVYATTEKFEYKPFKYNLYNLEEYLLCYDKYADKCNVDINELLDFAYKNISKRMIIFVITDINGIDNMKSRLLKKINKRHDILIVNVNDNYMSGNDIFDVVNDEYIPSFLSSDKKLNEIEQKMRKEMLTKNKSKLKRHKICMTSISSIKDINIKILNLLEEHKHANNS